MIQCHLTDDKLCGQTLMAYGLEGVFPFSYIKGSKTGRCAGVIFLGASRRWERTKSALWGRLPTSFFEGREGGRSHGPPVTPLAAPLSGYGKGRPPASRWCQDRQGRPSDSVGRFFRARPIQSNSIAPGGSQAVLGGWRSRPSPKPLRGRPLVQGVSACPSETKAAGPNVNSGGIV